jgi:hypothetical protein
MPDESTRNLGTDDLVGEDWQSDAQVTGTVVRKAAAASTSSSQQSFIDNRVKEHKRKTEE